MESPKSPKPADNEEKGFVDDTVAQRSVIDEEIAKVQKATQRVIAAEETAMNLSPRNISAIQEIQAAAANFALVALQAKKAFEMYVEPIASFFETHSMLGPSSSLLQLARLAPHCGPERRDNGVNTMDTA
jgi:hypothetical protein